CLGHADRGRHRSGCRPRHVASLGRSQLLFLHTLRRVWLRVGTSQRARVMTRPVTEAEKREGFMRATGGFSRSHERWAERAARGLTDAELAKALAFEIGIFGGSCGPGTLHLTYQGSGLKIWIS